MPDKTQPLNLRDRQRQLTRDVIADTARRLFLERGYDAVTVGEVASEAGVSEKTVFNHFPTKEDLVYHRMEAFEEAMLDAIRERAPDESVLDAFARYITTPRGLLAAGDPVAAEQLRAITRLIATTPALLAREEHIYAGYTSALAAQLAEESGAAPDDVAPWVAANAMIGLHRALVDYVRRQIVAGDADPGRLVRDLRAQARKGVAVLRSGLL